MFFFKLNYRSLTPSIRIKLLRDAKGETPDDFLEYMNSWSIESIGLIALDTRLGVLDNPEASKVNQAMKKFIQYAFEYDTLPGIWRLVKTPGFWRVMKTYEELTNMFRAYAEEAIKRLEGNIVDDEQEPGVFEKLLKVDKHVAFVMAFDMLVGGVETVNLQTFKNLK